LCHDIAMTNHLQLGGITPKTGPKRLKRILHPNTNTHL
jgi:hypothetical protein